MLKEDRNTPMREGFSLVLGVRAAVRIYAGALVAINSEGYAVPAYEDTDLKGLGRAEFNVDNMDGGDDDQTVEVRKGVFRFDNHKLDPVKIEHIGSDCYIVDDHTVAFTDKPGELRGGEVFRPLDDSTPKRGVAGEVFDVDASGVWVRFQ